MGAVLSLISLSSFATGCAAQVACCCGSSALALCSCCPSRVSSTATRAMYLLLFLLLNGVCWIMLNPAVAVRLNVSYSGTLNCTGLTKDECTTQWGQLGVFRVMFGSAVFFGLFALLTFNVQSSTDARTGLQNGFWGPKYLLVIALVVAAFFIKNTFFLVDFGYVGVSFAFLFLLIQMILLIDFAHSWAESWIVKMEDSNAYAAGLLFFAAVMYLTWIVGFVLMFVYYTNGSNGNDCSLHKFFLALNFVLTIISTIVVLLPSVREATPKTGLLQSGVVCLYATYLSWTAISNSTITECQPAYSSANETATVVCGCILTLISLVYFCLRTSSASHIGKIGTSNDDAQYLMGERDSNTDNEQSGVAYNWSFLHFTLAAGSLYVMMVLTNWGSLGGSSVSSIDVGEGMTCTYVNVVACWLASLLFIWSTIAPVVLPDRDWS